MAFWGIMKMEHFFMFKNIKRCLNLTSLGFMLLICLISISSCESSKKSLSIVTGWEEGIYFQMGKSLKRALERENGFRVEVLTSRGSFENLAMIQDGQVDLAIVQGDIFQDFPGMRSIAPLVEESVHILGRKGLGVQHIEGLRDKVVCIGPEYSGMAKTARRILTHVFGGPLNEPVCHLSFSDGFNKLLVGEIDAYISVTGVQSRGLHKFIETGQVEYINIGDGRKNSMIDGLCLRFPFYKPFTIPKNIFGQYPQEPVHTISVPSVLVVSQRLSNEQVFAISQTLFQQRMTLNEFDPPVVFIDEQFDRKTLPFALHEGTKYYLERNKPGFLERFADVIALFISVIVVLSSAVAAILKWSKIRAKNRVDKYYIQVISLHEKISETEDDGSLKEMRNRIRRIRQQAFSNLAKEKFRADVSFIILQNEINLALNEIENILQSR